MNEDQMTGLARESVADPMDEFRARFAEIRALMKRQITPEDRRAMRYRTDVLEKVRDMVKGQVLMHQAEEALHEEFKALRAADRTEVETLRAEIGRKLDRIRATLDPDSVSGGTD